MIVDAEAIDDNEIIDTDVCIVGGGVAGLTLARGLTGVPLRVCVLESGGLEPEPDVQALDSGANVGHPYYALDSARARVLGGSSSRWHVQLDAERVGARMRPLDAIDFEARPWVPHSGWPFDKEHLQPYYERADTMCGIGPPTYDLDRWEGESGRRRIPFADCDVQTIIYKLVPREVFARDLPRQVIDARNITTYVHATVLEIESNEGVTRVERLRVGTLRGNRFMVRARAYVLATGGIETPRLLLLSNKNQAAGLGNQHDLVGRFFMEHLHFWSGILVPRSARVFDRTTLYNDFTVTAGVAIAGKLALSEDLLRREHLLNQNVQLVRRESVDPFKYPRGGKQAVQSLKALMRLERLSESGDHVRSVVHGWDDIALALRTRIRRKLTGLPKRSVFIFANMAEQVPNPESRITLGCDRDVFGQNRVQLNWKITSQDIRSVVRTQEIMGAALESAGVGRLYRQLLDDTPPPDTHGGYHHMGTTRMHDSPTQGVVDRNSKVHGVENLYIAGPSVFPTGGYANPVLTIVALALRLGDHLRDLLMLGGSL